MEFSQILENKANQQDFQMLVQQIITSNPEFGKNEKLHNMLAESMLNSGYQEELEHLELFERQLNMTKTKDAQDDHESEPPMRESPVKIQSPHDDKTGFELNEISSINENELHLNQSLLKEALQNHNITTIKPNDDDNKENSTRNTEEEKIQQDRINALNAKIEDIYQSICQLIEKHCVSKQEHTDLETKIGNQQTRINEITEELAQKANKNSVANALHRKANK